MVAIGTPLSAQLNPPGKTPVKGTPQPGVPASGLSFSDRLKKAVLDVDTSQKVADMGAEQVVTGELGLHEGMMLQQQADLSMRLLVQARGKAMESIKEILRIQF